MNKYSVKYYVRLDDACPNMDHEKWSDILRILDKYSIKPLIGIIPHNKDLNTMPSKEDGYFWNIAREWQEKGYSIALHGYDHCYCSDDGGINPLFSRSEFAGLPFQEQLNKITLGYNILASYGLKPKIFFAPSHTFDENTIKALIEGSPIRMICDTMAFRPYQYHDITIIPQQVGSFRKILLPGDWVFCFHPNVMNDNSINVFERFIEKYRNNFHNFSTISLPANRAMSFSDKFLNKSYFLMRQLLKGKYSKL